MFRMEQITGEREFFYAMKWVDFQVLGLMDNYLLERRIFSFFLKRIKVISIGLLAFPMRF